MSVFQVAAVFSSNMVLQREKNIRIFGWGEDDQEVAVRFKDMDYTAKIQDGHWRVLLPPQEAGTGYDMVIQCGAEKRIFTNIAIGEVWLACGQSNMQFELQNCKGGPDMLSNDVNPKVRFYATPRLAYQNEKFYEAERNSSWSEFGVEAAKNWSAVGYVFAKKLAKDLDVTVGIIGCNWGGTSASNWMSEESLSEDQELSSYLDEYRKAIEGKSETEQLREYQEYIEYADEWGKNYAELLEKDPNITWDEAQRIIGPSRYPGPQGCSNPFRPAGLYQCMLQRVMPYTLRGFLYYQGESDDHKPNMYQKLLTRLIRQWREDWEDLTLPFLIVQLPMHRYKADPDYKNWCLIREAQMNTYRTIKNTGIAVALDCGEFNEIHPKDKTPVGERLELQALYHVYHRINEWEAFGPIYHSYVRKDQEMELSFVHADDGFVVKGEISGFEIAGEDGIYAPATPKLCGTKILLSSSQVPSPIAARYCWTNYGEVTIFGTNGLPLAPFRTDHW